MSKLVDNLAAASTPPPPPVIVKQPQVRTPSRVLFIGNSYFYFNDSLHNHVKRIAKAHPDLANVSKSLQFKSATIGGAQLSQHHIKSLTEPGRLGVEKHFELVVMAGNSTDALSDKARRKFRDSAVEFNSVIKERGGAVALYMTPAHIKPSKSASPDMIGKVSEMYVSVGNELEALVIPAALAFAEAYNQRPDIRLHQSNDGSHPTLLGTYLAACTVFSSLYGLSSIGNSYDYFGRLEKEDCAFCQKIADETLKRFYDCHEGKADSDDALVISNKLRVA
jgi:hypothetical protein